MEANSNGSIRDHPLGMGKVDLPLLKHTHTHTLDAARVERTHEE